jgi:hypothetical protein
MTEHELKLKFPDAEQYKLRHAIRLNGIVDVWNNRRTVFCIPDNEYKSLDHQERVKYIRECLDKHEKRDPMKKLKSGNMSIQEFRNNKRQQ